MIVNSKSLQQILRSTVSHPRLTIQSIIAVIVTAGVILSFGYVVRVLIDRGFSQGAHQFIDLSVFALIAGAIILAISAYVRTRSTALLAEKVVSEMRLNLFKHILSLRMESFEQVRLGELLSKLGSDFEQVRLFISSSLAVTVRVVLQIVGGSVLLVITSSKLAILVLSFAPLVVLPIFFFGKRVKRQTTEIQNIEGSILSFAEERLNAFELVKAYLQEKTIAASFNELLSHKMSFLEKRAHMRSLLIGLVIALVFSAISFILWLGAREVLNGAITPGQLTAFIIYAVIVAGSVNNFAEIISELNASTGALNSINHIYEYATEDKKKTTEKKALFLESIEFKNIGFSYPARADLPVFNHLNFRIEGNEKIAIVGPSGVGKSTIFNLLLGFYRANVGDILFNDKVVQPRDFPLFRDNFALVSQQSHIFNDTVYNNISFGAQSNITKNDVINAAKRAHVDDFVQNFPEGYETIVGEKGVKLSGGQRQRIAIARAILSNAPVFLLDEATNALDSESERLIQETLGDVLKDKMALIIAHRLSTIRNCDRIFVLSRKGIDSIGTHEALLKSSKLYLKLAQQQFLIES